VLIVDAHPRVGDAWRRRWDSLRLFTPRDVDGLPHVAFPRGLDPFPRKDEVADFQEGYAREMGFTLRLGERARSVRRSGKGFAVDIGSDALRAETVIAAAGHFQAPRIPELAARLDPSVLQLHSSEYRRPSQLPDGPVVVVGAANSGGEIAVEVARERPTTIAIGTRKPLPPKRWRDPFWWKLALVRDRILHERTAGIRWLPWPIRPGGYLEADLDRAARDHGLHLAPRAVDADGDLIRFADGTTAKARTVIWATGFRADHSWIDARKDDGVIPIGRHGRTPVPGLWFVRGRFLFAISRHAREVARDVRRVG
jgi:putative flavoprotein involved in K+ transport